MNPVDVLEYNEGYYENGRLHGEHLRKSEHFESMLGMIKSVGPYTQDPSEIKAMLRLFCPPLVEELKGIQDVLKITEREALQIFAGYDMPVFKGMGCTSFITKDYYVRNYDFSPDLYDHTFIIQKHNNKKWFCGNSQLILGRLDGMNHKGLIVGLHFVNNDSYAKGFLCSTIVRILLEMCENVEEAIHLLKEIPHAASYNYSLLDQNGDSAVFEATPSSSNVRREEGSMVCVNMFQSEEMGMYNRTQIHTSLERISNLAQFYKTSKQVDEIHTWFSDISSPIFYTNYNEYFGTLHTVTYLPRNKGIILTAAGITQKLVLNF